MSRGVCGAPAIDVGGVTPQCDMPKGHRGQHGHTALEDGKPRTYRWGKRSGTTLSYEARKETERPLMSLTVARDTQTALAELATRTGRSRGVIVDDAVRALWGRYERGEWPAEDDE